jgi:hypothetical protein
MHYEIAMSERMIRVISRKDDKSFVDSFVSNLITEIQSRTADSKRLQQFVMQYNKEFKKRELMNTFSRDVIQPYILTLMRGPLTLYALNMNGEVLIDLAGILERYTIIYITELFGSFPARQDVVRQLLERQFLDKLAKHLIILGLWDKKDENEILKLKKARDGVAHKNVEIVRKEINNGKPISVLEIDLVMSKKDVLPYIMLAIRLLVKMVDRFWSKTDRSIIAQQIMEGKIKDVSEFFH